MTDVPQAPAGWYPDPQNPAHQRFWDGSIWAAPGTAPPPPSAPPPPPMYAPPGATYGYQKQSVNGFAIASLVLGIVWIYWIGSILALVFGYMAKRQIAASNGNEGGGGLATAGIVLGWIGIGLGVLFFVLIIVVAGLGHSSGSTYQP